MTAALRTALREACAELRDHNASTEKFTPNALIDAWERLADEAGPGPGEPFEVWREQTLQEHRDEVAARIAAGSCPAPEQPIAPDPARRWCVECDAVVPGGGCCECCIRADGSSGGACPNHPPLPGNRDVKPAPVTRTADDINAEIYGQRPYSGSGLKRGPGGTGRSGPCDEDCRKCELGKAEIAQAVDRAPEPGAGAALIAAVDRVGGIVKRGELRGALEHLRGEPEDPPLALWEPFRAPTHAVLCCARLGSVWCTEPHGHAGACKGPEEREIAGNDFGPRRKR